MPSEKMTPSCGIWLTTSNFSPARTLPHTIPASDALLTNGSRTLKHSFGVSQAKRNPSRTGATASAPANGSTTPAAPLRTALSQPVDPAPVETSGNGGLEPGQGFVVGALFVFVGFEGDAGVFQVEPGLLPRHEA